MYRNWLNRAFAFGSLAIALMGCDRAPIVEVIADTQQDTDHVHQHQHGQQHRHDHVHDSFASGSHSHAHRHMHRHVEPPNGGIIVSLILVGNQLTSPLEIEEPHLEIVPQLPETLLFYLHDCDPSGAFSPIEVDDDALKLTMSDDQSGTHQITGTRQKDGGYRAAIPSPLSKLFVATTDSVGLKIDSAELGELSFHIPESLVYRLGELDVVVD